MPRERPGGEIGMMPKSQHTYIRRNVSTIRSTFLRADLNRARVLECLLGEGIVTTDQYDHMDRDFAEFMSHRSEYMSHDQIVAMNRVINRERTALSRSIQTEEQRNLRKLANRQRMSLARANMTQDERDLVKEADRQRRLQARACMTQAERGLMKEGDRQRRSQAQTVNQEEQDLMEDKQQQMSRVCASVGEPWTNILYIKMEEPDNTEDLPQREDSENSVNVTEEKDTSDNRDIKLDKTEFAKDTIPGGEQ